MAPIKILPSKHVKTTKAYEEEDPFSDFFYKPRRAPVDYRLLSSINIAEIQSENNIEILQKSITNITYCETDSLRVEEADKSLVKMFQLSQMIIEFLLYSQKVLAKEQQVAVAEAAALSHELDQAKATAEKNNKILQENRKEMKSLRKAVFAYELIAKPVVGGQVFKCRSCPKSFSSKDYLSSHQERRHTQDTVSEEAGKKGASKNDDLKRVVDLIEKFTVQLTEKENQKNAVDLPVITPEKTLEQKLEDRIKQESLNMEMQLQSLSAKMHQELEEERAELQKERAVFQSLVDSKKDVKVDSHVGELEDEDEFSRLSKSSSKPPVTVLIEQNSMEMMEKKFQSQIDSIKLEINRENNLKSKSIEDKLLIATSEIKRLRADNVFKPAAIYSEDKSSTLPTLSVKIPNNQQELTILEKHEIWKKYLAILKSNSCVPNPDAKWATSKYQHPSSVMDNEKSQLTNDLDGFLASNFGLTETNISRLSSNNVQGMNDFLDTQRKAGDDQVDFYEDMRSYLENYIDDQALNTIHTSSPVVQPQFIRKSSSGTFMQQSPKRSITAMSNLQSPSRASFANSFIQKSPARSTLTTMQKPSPVRSNNDAPPSPARVRSKSAAYPLQSLSPARSSLRNPSSSILSPSKSVKMHMMAEERTIDPQSSRSIAVSQSPVKGLSVSIPERELQNATPPPRSLNLTPQDQSPSSKSMFASVKNAFSMISKLASPSRHQPKLSFDHAMAAASTPTLPPRSAPKPPPKQYINIQRVPVVSSESASVTATTSGYTSGDDSTGTSISSDSPAAAPPKESKPTALAKIAQPPITQPMIKTTLTHLQPSKSDHDRTSSDISFSISEISDKTDNKILDKVDAFDLITDVENLPPLSFPNRNKVMSPPSKKPEILQSDNDDDVLEFLEEIDASLGNRRTGNVMGDAVEIDDIDDFDI